MVTIINTMEVKDFGTWKQHFDGGAENRSRAGINIQNVYTDTDNENKITVVSEVADAETAKAFIANLKPALEKFGAVGEPQIMMLNKI
jgi:hypothetical protein